MREVTKRLNSQTLLPLGQPINGFAPNGWMRFMLMLRVIRGGLRRIIKYRGTGGTDKSPLALNISTPLTYVFTFSYPQGVEKKRPISGFKPRK